MSHSATLDNGVVFVCNSDLSGPVTMVLPDHRTVVTDWDTLANAENLKLAATDLLKKVRDFSERKTGDGLNAVEYQINMLRDAVWKCEGRD